MKQNTNNAENRTNNIFNRLAAEKKKTIFALCLIALMVLMWVRIFAQKAPEAAQAALTANQEGVKEQEGPQVKITYIELPQIQGRNDVIARDFFDPNGWIDFMPGGERSAGGKRAGIDRDSMNVQSRLMQAGLNLEAIELGGNPRAFINGRLLSIGDKFVISDGNDNYECEVSRIEKNLVFIRCEGVEIELKLVSEG